MTATEPGRDYPSTEAMKSAVELEIQSALASGRVPTVEIGRMIDQAIAARLSTPADQAVREVLRLVEFRGQQGKCPLCAGWGMSPSGETPGKHTKDCPVGIALSTTEPKRS